jgi:hypothetical protein
MRRGSRTGADFDLSPAENFPPSFPPRSYFSAAATTRKHVPLSGMFHVSFDIIPTEFSEGKLK